MPHTTGPAKTGRRKLNEIYSNREHVWRRAEHFLYQRDRHLLSEERQRLIENGTITPAYATKPTRLEKDGSGQWKQIITV